MRGRGQRPKGGPCLIAGLLIYFNAPGILMRLPAGQDTPADQRLARILERAKAYCLRLEKASLDFTCVEKIEERTYRATEIQPDAVFGNPASSSGAVGYSYPTPRPHTIAHTYVYDYQFIRKGERRVERRTLIEEDGRKRDADDAELATEVIRVENALFGPIGLLGEAWQARHDYRLVGEETMGGRKVVTIEATPKARSDSPHCFGRIWVREDDGSVLKISWDQTSVGNYQAIQARARYLGAEPRLTCVTEYGREKNGLCFPSKDTTEEAYLKKGKTHVLSRSTILYKDYRFFTVETEVRYK